MIYTKGKCTYKPGERCTAVSTFEIFNKNDEGITYNWDVIGEDVTSFGPKDAKKIHVYTNSNKNSEYTVICEITYSNGEKVLKSGVFRDERNIIEEEKLCVQDLIELSSGQCFFDSEDTCKATSKYQVITNISTGIVYKWSTQNCDIIAGQGTDTCTVQTNSNKHEYFFIKCILYDKYYNTVEIYGNFSHTRYVNPGCYYFRSKSELGYESHEAYSPSDYTYLRTSGIETCIKSESGRIYTKDELEKGKSYINTIRCLNFNSSVDDEFENFRHKDGNFIVASIYNSCKEK